jgi:hypothetical protein
MTDVDVRVTVASEFPPKDIGLLYPEPEFCMGINVIVTCGEAVSDPRNVMSGSILQTKPK